MTFDPCSFSQVTHLSEAEEPFRAGAFWALFWEALPLPSACPSLTCPCRESPYPPGQPMKGSGATSFTGQCLKLAHSSEKSDVKMALRPDVGDERETIPKPLQEGQSLAQTEMWPCVMHDTGWTGQWQSPAVLVQGARQRH